MQFIIPMLLLFAALGDREYDPSVRKVDQIVDSIFSCDIVPYSTFPKDDDQGGAYNSLHGKVMAFLVVAFYFFKVVPDTFVSFYNTAGTADTTYSRIMSMRKMVWDQGDDYVGQMLGYKFDLYMNTAFECFLYMLNLFIIYNTNDILDVILNALAIEFVHQVSWWSAWKISALFYLVSPLTPFFALIAARRGLPGFGLVGCGRSPHPGRSVRAHHPKDPRPKCPPGPKTLCSCLSH